MVFVNWSLTSRKNRRKQRIPHQRNSPLPSHTATTRADYINIIHCAARSCKVLCAINAERTDHRMIDILEELANDNLHPNSRYYRRNTAFDLATKKASDAEGALGG